MRYVFRAKPVGVVFCNETGIEISRHKLGVRQERRLKWDVATDTPNHKAVECFAHFGNGIEPVFTVNNQLGNHRVIKHRNFTAVLHSGIDPYAIQMVGIRLPHGLGGRGKTNQSPGGREEVTERVFRIDSAFHRPTLALDLGLRERQLFARCDADHQLN